jgi:hypothetical protein
MLLPTGLPNVLAADQRRLRAQIRQDAVHRRLARRSRAAGADEAIFIDAIDCGCGAKNRVKFSSTWTGGAP